MTAQQLSKSNTFWSISHLLSVKHERQVYSNQHLIKPLMLLCLDEGLRRTLSCLIIQKTEKFTFHQLTHFLLKPLISVCEHMCVSEAVMMLLLLYWVRAGAERRGGRRLTTLRRFAKWVLTEWPGCAGLRIRHIELLTLLWQARGLGQLVLHYIKFKRNDKIVKRYILSQSIFIHSKAQNFTGTVYHKI